MMFLEQLGDIYWHASVYHDFFQLALSVRQASSELVSSNEGDPLVAFLKRQMVSRGGGFDRAHLMTSEGAQEVDGAKAAQTENISADHNRVYESPGPCSLETAPEMDDTASDQQDVQFEEWLDFGAGFHSIFPAA